MKRGVRFYNLNPCSLWTLPVPDLRSLQMHCVRGARARVASRSSSDNNPAEARSKFFSFSLRQISVNLRKRDKRRIRVVRDRERGRWWVCGVGIDRARIIENRGRRAALEEEEDEKTVSDLDILPSSIHVGGRFILVYGGLPYMMSTYFLDFFYPLPPPLSTKLIHTVCPQICCIS